MEFDSIDRRQVLATAGTALAAGLAGCAGGGGGDGGGDTPTDTASPTPTESPTPTSGGGDYTMQEQRVVDYLSGDPPAKQFDGQFVDKTGMDEVVVDVGGGPNGLAFTPPAMKITVGTTISWQWTGKGGSHNVVSVSSGDYGADWTSDFDFDSGDPKTSGDPFEQSFDDTGVGLYFCEVHKSLGMEGGFVVVE